MKKIIDNSVQAEITRLQNEKNKIELQLEKLKKKLDCDHDVEKTLYSDYHSKITTYTCKKCKQSVDF